MTSKQWGPFDEGPLSIEERFEVQGRKRQDEVWRIYVTQDDASAPFFDTSGLGDYGLWWMINQSRPQTDLQKMFST